MGKFDIQGVEPVEIAIDSFGGLNTADSFSRIALTQSPSLLNCLPNKIGGLSQRPGTVPLTTTALTSAIKVLCNLRKADDNSILATAGTTLYKYNDTTKVFDAQTMTNALVTADIDHAQFKDANAAEVLIIADGGNLKSYDGTAVTDITPAVDDAPPLPPNDLATINTDNPPIGCLVHNTRLVIWGANSDTIHHSKVGYFDYFPNVNFQRFVRENDYVVTCVSFSGALIVFMRRHVGVLFGDGLTDPPSAEDWSQDFLDTVDGCINAKTVQTVTYPNGVEEIFYLSDHGVHSIYTINTLSLDTSARYSTKSMTRNLIDWDALGVTKTEWGKAVAHFYDGKYWLIYPKGTAWNGLVFDTNNGQWYPVDHIVANGIYHDENYLYYAGDAGHLRVFDDTLNDDWNEAAKTTGTPINWYWYSKLLNPKLTGYDHFWDILMIEAKQFAQTSTIDVEVNTYRDQYTKTGAIKTEIMVWGVSKWGEAEYANSKLTDIVNNAKRIGTFVKGQYAQIKLSNPRSEPVEVFSIKYEVRPMTKY